MLKWLKGAWQLLWRWLWLTVCIVLVSGAIIGLAIWRFSSEIDQFIAPSGRKALPLIPVAGTENSERLGDVVFVHGLNASAKDNWGKPGSEFYWPQWIHDRSPEVGVWLLDYDAYSTKYGGASMPIGDRAENLLEEMQLAGIGDRPVIFIGHSLGGIMSAKMMEKGHTLNNAKHKRIATSTRGIVFVASPLSGSNQATALNNIGLLARNNEIVSELKADASGLRDLLTWYRNNSKRYEIATKCYFETQDTGKWGRIVTESSANPGIDGVYPIGLTEDHLSIAKPDSANKQIVKGVKQFIDEHLAPPGVPDPISIDDFMQHFSEVRANPAAFEVLRAKYKGKRFTWDAYVISVIPASPSPTNPDSKPAYIIGATESAKALDFVNARFGTPGDNWDLAMQQKTKIRITGEFDWENSKTNAIVLKRCNVLEVLELPKE